METGDTAARAENDPEQGAKNPIETFSILLATKGELACLGSCRRKSGWVLYLRHV